MIHTLAKEYGWSKSQIEEVYPEEAVVMLRFLAFERKDEALQEKLDYYRANVDLLHIQHGEPEKLRDSFIQTIEKLQSLKIHINTPEVDDDLPDYGRLKKLREFMGRNQK